MAKKIDVTGPIEAVLRETGLWGQWVRLAETLNERGITTPQGGPWKPFNLSRYCKRTWPESVPQESTDSTQGDLLVSDSTQDSTPGTQEITPERVPEDEPELVTQESTGNTQESTVIGEITDNTPATPVHTGAHDGPQVDPNDIADLAELLNWWRDRRDELTTPRTTAHSGTQESTPLPTPTVRPIFSGPRTTTKTIRMSAGLADAAARYAREHRAETGGTFSEFVEWLVWRELGCEERFIEVSTQESTESTESPE